MREFNDINETALLSELSLAKDWNTPEEDEAWRNLDEIPALAETLNDGEIQEL